MRRREQALKKVNIIYEQEINFQNFEICFFRNIYLRGGIIAVSYSKPFLNNPYRFPQWQIQIACMSEELTRRRHRYHYRGIPNLGGEICSPPAQHCVRSDNVVAYSKLSYYCELKRK